MLVETNASLTAATTSTTNASSVVEDQVLRNLEGFKVLSSVTGRQPWHPGLPPAILYGALLSRKGGNTPRGLMQEGAVLPGIGAAAASLPGQIRRVVEALGNLHQVSE